MQIGSFFCVTIFPNFSFLSAYVSDILEERTCFFFVSNCSDLCRFKDFSVPKSIFYLTKVRISLCLLSPDMFCIVFSFVVYSHMKAFLKKRGK